MSGKQGDTNKFGWIKNAVTPIKKVSLQESNPIAWALMQQQERKKQKEAEEEKKQNLQAKKDAGKRLDTQVTGINGYLLQLKQALQEEHQHLEINWSFVETENISNLQFSCFNDVAGWDQFANGQHDFEGPVDIQDPPRAHGALSDTLYKTTVHKTCTIALNHNEKWVIDVYPGLFNTRFAVFSGTGFCSTMKEIKTAIQKCIEKKLKEAAE